MGAISALPAAYILIAVNVLLSLIAFSNAEFFRAMKFEVEAVARGGEYHRLLTSGFLHVDPTHLLFNMVTLFFFGPYLEKLMGLNGFLAVYFVSLFAGNIWALIENINNPFYSAVGASGAISGVLIAFSLFLPFQLIFVFFVPIPAIVYAVLFIGYSAFAMGRDNSNIGHEAHLGGAIAGLIVTMILNPGIVNNLIERIKGLF